MAFQMLQGVKLDWTEGFLRDGLVTGEHRLPGLRGYYRPALDLAIAIIGRKAVMLDRSGSHVRLPSMLIDMGTVFEAYLREVLTTASNRETWSVAVLDGNLEPPYGALGKVFDSGASIDASPDVVLRTTENGHAHRDPVIVEVKYKPAGSAPKREDLNQAITYGVAYKADQVVIAQPRSRDSLLPSGLRPLGTIRRMAVSQYVFDLGAADLKAEEMRWSGEIKRLLPPLLTGG